MKLWEDNILKVVGQKARADIIEEEDRRALSIMMEEDMSDPMEQVGHPTLNVVALQSALRKMVKRDIIDQFLTVHEKLVRARLDVFDAQKKVSRFEIEIEHANDKLEFWRLKAFEFQKQVNDLMGILAASNE